MDAVAAGVGAHQQQNAARHSRRGRGQPVFADQPDAHGINQRIAGVGLIEIDLATDVRHADAVSVPRYATHDAAEKVAVCCAVYGVIKRSEAQGIEQRDGARAHGQDIPHNASDTRGRPLEGLHGRGMVVRLHLEHHS